MKKYCVIPFFIVLILQSLCAVNAQDRHLLDSLKQALHNVKEDTSKVNAYFLLSYNYQWSYPDSALFYAIPGLTLARRINFEKGEINILHSLGEVLSMKGNYSTALEMQFKALDLAKKLNDNKETGKAIALIGAVYFYAKDYQKALMYFRKTRDMIGTNGPLEIIYAFLGEAYYHLNQLDSALFYTKKAYYLDLDAASHWSTPYFYLAAISEKKGKLADAIHLYTTAVAVSRTKLDAILAYNGMSSAFKKVNQTDSAIFYAKKAIEESALASLPSPVIDASTLLTEIYKSTRNPDSAFKYQELMVAATDSLFSQEKMRRMQNVAFDEQLRQQEVELAREQYTNKVKLYVSLATVAVLIIIGMILWRSNKHKQEAYGVLQKQKSETDRQRVKVEQTLAELRITQAQLIQSEKMASLGELTAGIAHEIQNPLNFVNNFSDVNTELIEELEQQADKGNLEEVKAIANDIKENERKINHHGRRADAIVKGMLQHSRASTGKKELTDINALADEYLRLAYHGLRAKDKDFNADLKTDFDESIGKVEVVPQDIGRVLLNLYNNAFQAVPEKKKHQGDGYSPTVKVATKRLGNKIEIIVTDNGTGIPPNIADKIFQPFFTTKPTGQGTGLGLSLSYDIIKAHGGEIKVQTKEGEGSDFIIELPME